VPVKRTCKT